MFKMLFKLKKPGIGSVATEFKGRQYQLHFLLSAFPYIFLIPLLTFITIFWLPAPCKQEFFWGYIAWIEGLFDILGTLCRNSRASSSARVSICQKLLPPFFPSLIKNTDSVEFIRISSLFTGWWIKNNVWYSTVY